MKIPTTHFRQQGVSLVVTLILVVLMSLLALYGAGVLVLDTRSAANDYRAREAMTAAESGLDQGFSLLSINRNRISSSGLDTNGDGTVGTGEPTWLTCASGDTTAPCVAIRSGGSADLGSRRYWSYLTLNTALTTAPTLGSFALYLMTPSSGSSNLLVYNVVARGLSADGSSNAIAKQGAYFYPLIVGNVDTPLASASNVPLSGNYSIIANSNGGGSGVPVSVWTGTAVSVTGNGSYATCHAGDFSGGACPSGSALSKKNQAGPDLVSDPAFPTDLFEFLFGVDELDYQQIKDQATVSANCDGMGTSTQGIQWVTGDCNPPGDVGSAARPVLMVVQGDTTLNSGSNFYGMLFMFDPAGGTPKLTANGNATLRGAILAHDNIDLQLNGGFVLEYNSAVLDALANSASNRGLTRLPGSWTDVQ